MFSFKYVFGLLRFPQVFRSWPFSEQPEAELEDHKRRKERFRSTFVSCFSGLFLDGIGIPKYRSWLPVRWLGFQIFKFLIEKSINLSEMNLLLHIPESNQWLLTNKWFQCSWQAGHNLTDCMLQPHRFSWLYVLF